MHDVSTRSTTQNIRELFIHSSDVFLLSLSLRLVRDYGAVYAQIGVSSRKEHLKEKFMSCLTVLEIKDYNVDAHSLILNLNTRIELN